MIAGTALSRIETDATLELRPPRLTDSLTHPQDGQLVECSLMLDSGFIHLACYSRETK
jgi:hypothetical protein